MSGPATRDDLGQLHRRVFEMLIERMKAARRPGVEWLAVARGFLADNGYRGSWAMPTKTQKKLEKLYAAYCVQLTRAMAEEQPSPKMLGEVRAFLSSQGIDKDFTALADRASAGRAAELLASLDVPFKVH